jgi:hypothetical protein
VSRDVEVVVISKFTFTIVSVVSVSRPSVVEGFRYVVIDVRMEDFEIRECDKITER